MQRWTKNILGNNIENDNCEETTTNSFTFNNSNNNNEQDIDKIDNIYAENRNFNVLVKRTSQDSNNIKSDSGNSNDSRSNIKYDSDYYITKDIDNTENDSSTENDNIESDISDSNYDETDINEFLCNNIRLYDNSTLSVNEAVLKLLSIFMREKLKKSLYTKY